MTITHAFVSAISDDGDATKVRPSNWNANHVVVGGLIGTYSESIGNGSATSIVVTHGLETVDVVVSLWDLSGADPVEATADATSITATDINEVTIVFGSAPATDAYRAVVLSSGGVIAMPGGATAASKVYAYSAFR